MRSSLLVASTFCSLAVACAVPQNDSPTAETTAQTATAVVTVERVAGPGDISRESVVARFVRARQGSIDEQALKMAGIAQELPAIGTCSTAPSVESLSPRAVDLLDVGLLSVDAPHGTNALLPRAIPDPAGVVSGVFYSSTRASDVFEAGAALSLRAGGGADLEGFSVQVVAPRELSDVQVASLAAGLDVTWEGADSRDLVYLDVLAPAPRLVVRCTTTDYGHFVVPRSSLVGVEEGQVAVHRLHRETFRAKGIDPGEVRFDLTRIVTFR